MQDFSYCTNQDGTCGFPISWIIGVNHSSKVIHARSGVPYEIMGLMQGKVVGTSLVVMDSFALPVQGTETRVNAANEANEYMVEYIGKSEKVILILTVPAFVLTGIRKRQEDSSTPLVGITHTLVMVVGYLGSTLVRS